MLRLLNYIRVQNKKNLKSESGGQNRTFNSQTVINSQVTQCSNNLGYVLDILQICQTFKQFSIIKIQNLHVGSIDTLRLMDIFRIIIIIALRTFLRNFSRQ